MPKNMKQEIFFTLLMVPTMVTVMVFYNNYLAMGSVKAISLSHVIYEFCLMGIIAAIIEVPLIAPLAQKIAFNIINPRTCKPILIPLTISCCTVCMMCPFMSLMANIVLINNLDHIMDIWPKMAAINFPVALSWQLFVAGPFVRALFKRFMSTSLCQRVLN